MHVHNLITRANYQTRLAVRDQVSINKALEQASWTSHWKAHAAEFAAWESRCCAPAVRRRTAADRADCRDQRIHGRLFTTRAARPAGAVVAGIRSQNPAVSLPLQFSDLHAAFDALPEPQLAFLADRLQTILAGEDTTGRYQNLSPEDRQAVREILLETKPEFTKRWTQKE